MSKPAKPASGHSQYLPFTMPAKGAPVAAALDLVQFEIIKGIEGTLAGQLLSNDTQRAVVAAYLSGMMGAMDLISIRKGQPIFLPAVVQAKVMAVGATLGLQFNKPQ